MIFFTYSISLIFMIFLTGGKLFHNKGAKKFDVRNIVVTSSIGTYKNIVRFGLSTRKLPKGSPSWNCTHPSTLNCRVLIRYDTFTTLKYVVIRKVSTPLITNV